MASNFLLFFLLVIWPLSSYFLMSDFGSGGGAQSTEFYLENANLVTQIYLPTVFIQLLVFLLIFLVLRLCKEGFSSIGLGGFNFKNLFTGIIFWVGISFFFLLMVNTLQIYKFFTPPQISHLLPKTQIQKIIWVIMALSASVSEESAFRGFVLTRLNSHIGNWWLTILIASLFFSLGHLYQGFSGMIFAGLYGASFSVLFLWRKSLFPCITAHFIQDIIPLFAP